MLRHVTTLKLSEASRLKLQEHGFHYVEDLPRALLHPQSIPRAVRSIIESTQFKEELPKRCTALDSWQVECCQPPLPVFHRGLDHLCGGGLPVGRITELHGAPGSGKTQLCLQLCVDVQVSPLIGGAGGEALFISTDFGFCLERLQQIAASSIKHCTAATKDEVMSMDKVLKGVHVLSVQGHQALLDSFSQLDAYLTANPTIKLLIVDSFSFPLVTYVVDLLSRTRLVAILLDKLLHLATTFKLAVVVTNQLTTLLLPGHDKKLIPSLGEGFGHRVHQRILLGNKKMFLVKSIDRPQLYFDFEITSSGIR